MKAEIISIGNEILCGNIIDTNSQHIIQKLSEINIPVHHLSAVRDNEKDIIVSLHTAFNRSDVIITTGGLGPTEDDMTFQSVAKAFDLKLKKCFEAEDHLKSILNQLKVCNSKSNLKQSYLPEGAYCIINPYGTAPAMMLEINSHIIISLPGVPFEMKKLMLEKIIPLLTQRFTALQKRESRIIRTTGIGESVINEMIKEFIYENQDLDIGIYASPEDIQIQLNVKADSKEKITGILNKATKKLEILLGNSIVSTNGYTLEQVIGEMLKEQKLTLAVAESCTGGMLGEIITTVSGSSAYFKGGIISYDGEIKKSLLNVPKNIMIQYGQVSQQVAEAMAIGTREKCKSDIGISITGIAGPEGGSPEKPVGLVCMALSDKDKTIVQKHQLRQDRQIIRLRAARKALNMLRLYLMNSLN